MDMHRNGRAGEHDGPYIWLRYSTQFTSGGRAHTIEMEIPVPVGASAELREQLIREAEAGIEQMYRQIEKRGAGRGQQPADAGRPQGAPATPPRTPAPSAPPAQAAAQANARDTAQPIPLPGKRETAETPAPARSSIGSEMPITPNLSSTATGNMRLAEFIQIIRNNWGLTPKDAMDLLQVPNLNNMNYRELLRQLEVLVEQRGKAAVKNTNNAARPVPTPAPAASAPRSPASASPSSSGSAMRDAGGSGRSAPSSPPPIPAPPANTAKRAPTPAPPAPKPAAPPASQALDGPANIPVYPLPGNTLREVPRSYKFDEEDDEAEAAQDGKGEDENDMSETMARMKIDDLREIRGTATVGPARLTVLHNLLDSQISDEQFQQLIEGLWNINSDKKLKQDQVEALISWAKEDYFEDEVRAVLTVFKG